MSAFTSRWKQLPIAASLLGLAVVSIIAGIYLLSYRQRESYLAGRNFRLLAVLAKQTEGAIDAHAHTRAAALGHATPAIRQLDLADGDARLTLVFAAARKRTAESRNVDAILRPVFEKKIGQGAFDTVALAEPGGRLVFAVGRREWEMRSMTLSALLPGQRGTDRASSSEPAATGKAAPLTSATTRPPAALSENGPAFERIEVRDAVVAGVAYKMFVQPCCELVTEAGSGRNGAVVVGLVPSGALRDEAMAVSPTLVVIAILLIVLVGLAWPFMNVALLGQRKRITRWDAFQLGFSGTVGLAVATILAITSVQCVRLEGDLERQLERLAAEIDTNLAAEIEESARTLDALERWLLTCPRSAGPVGHAIEGSCREEGAAAVDVAQFTNYDFAALINSEGRQKRKATPESRPPALVNVDDRSYFRTALSQAKDPATREVLNGKTSISCLGWPCVLDSVVAYVTGKPSAVLARPSRDASLPVAALTVPMRSVIDPVLPPGFEFAVIDKTGRVIFHSDVQRNGFEDLFLESDRNPQLRGLVANGVDGPLTTVYWGRPYIAYVKHAQAYGWSVVTLFNRRDLRALMLEWTMVSVLLLAAYSLLWAAALGAAVAKGAPWLWPDRFRRGRYALLTAIYVMLLIGFARWATSAWFERSAMAVAGFLVPAVACASGVVLLLRQPLARVGAARLDYRIGYCVPATLLLIIIGIVPGVAFVARSYDVHIEAFVKHRQLGIVQGLLEPQSIDGNVERPSDTSGKTRTKVAPARHSYSQFLETSVCVDPDTGESRPAATVAAAAPGAESLKACPPALHPSFRNAPPGHGEGRDPFGLLEAYLPYFSEMSVKIRELVHEQADDRSWTSGRGNGRTILHVHHPGATAPRVVTASTTLPRLIGGERTGGLLVTIAILLAAMAYGIAYFIARYVFLGRVSAPRWAVGRLAIPEGEPVILVCDPKEMAPRVHGAVPLLLEPLAAAADPRAALAQELTRLGRDRYDGRPILVPDFDSRESGVTTMAVKSKLLAALGGARAGAVLALSSRTLPERLAAAEAAEPRSRDARTLARAGAELQKAGAIELDWRDHPGAARGPLVVSSDPGLRHWWRRLFALWRLLSGSRSPAPPRTRARHSIQEQLMHVEERAHPELGPSCARVRRLDAFRENRMSHVEILDEIQEGAEDTYARLWKRCSDDEKLELRHIAQFGLASPGNGRAVLQLIKRRLVIKDPNLRLMNHTFRRFVLSSLNERHLPQLDVARIEGNLAPSGLDRFRGLTTLLVIGVTAFLFITQRETYNATIGAVLALTTQLPNILKVASVLAQKDLAGPGGSRNA